jgi:hypothetical protein
MEGPIKSRVRCANWNRSGRGGEAGLWLELLIESGIIKTEMTEKLLQEAKELAAILTASQQTAKRSA